MAQVDDLILFTAQVVLKMRDDYNTTADCVITPWFTPWFVVRVRTYFYAGDDVATAARKIVNENAVRKPPKYKSFNSPV